MRFNTDYRKCNNYCDSNCTLYTTDASLKMENAFIIVERRKIKKNRLVSFAKKVGIFDP